MAATVTGTFVAGDGTPEVRPITFIRVPTPDEEGGSVITDSRVARYPNSSGLVSLSLLVGVYRVFTGNVEFGSRYFTIQLTDTSGTVDVSAIVTTTPTSSDDDTAGIGYILTTLRARTRHAAPQTAYVLGLSSAGDGGSGQFYFSSSSSAADDGGLSVIKPNDVETGDPGRWLRVS